MHCSIHLPECAVKVKRSLADFRPWDANKRIRKGVIMIGKKAEKLLPKAIEIAQINRKRFTLFTLMWKLGIGYNMANQLINELNLRCYIGGIIPVPTGGYRIDVYI